MYVYIYLYSQVLRSLKILQCDGIRNMTSSMFGSFSQFLKFILRKGSLPPLL